MDLRHKELYWLLGRSSPLSVGNKLLPYRSLITPLLLYEPMALNYGSVPASPILQSYRDASLKYYEQLLTPRGSHQCYDPRRPRYSNCARSHPHQKYKAPYKTRNSLEPTTPPHATG